MRCKGQFVPAAARGSSYQLFNCAKGKCDNALTQLLPATFFPLSLSLSLRWLAFGKLVFCPAMWLCYARIILKASARRNYRNWTFSPLSRVLPREQREREREKDAGIYLNFRGQIFASGARVLTASRERSLRKLFLMIILSNFFFPLARTYIYFPGRDKVVRVCSVLGAFPAI